MREPPAVDLALAINYLPVCLCGLKAVALGFALCAARAADMQPSYVPLLLLLLLDRLFVPSRIFDANGLLLAIWGAHVVAEVQAHAAPPLPHPRLLHALLSCTWIALALRQLYVAHSRPPSHPRVALALVAAHIAALAFVPVTPEPHGVRLLRSTAFPLLAVGWLYSVGIYRHRHVVPDSAVHALVHFAPVLFAHPYAAVAHAAAIVLVGALQVASHAVPRQSEQAHGGPPSQPEEPPDEELERVFRQAKSSLQHPPSI
jgi:hypothetical protein